MNNLRKFIHYLLQASVVVVVFVFSLSLLFLNNKFTDSVLTNLFYYFEYEIEFKNLNSVWHPYKPLLIIDSVKFYDPQSKLEKIVLYRTEVKLNLLKLFYLEPLDSLSVIEGSIIISEDQQSSSLPLNYPYFNFYGLQHIDLKNISLSKKDISSEIYIDRIYADFSHTSDSSFYLLLKNKTQDGHLTISLKPQFNQAMSDSFLGEIKISQLDFADPFMRDLCSLCSNFGKVEGDIKLNYLNQKLINLFGRINLSSPKFLDSKGKLHADISLNNAVEGPTFNIKSSYSFNNKKFLLPDIFLSLLDDTLKLDIDELQFSDPFIQLKIKNILPSSLKNYALAGDLQNLTGLFRNEGEYTISATLRDLKLENKLGKSSYAGLNGKLIFSGQEALVRINSPSLFINIEDVFDQKIVLNNFKGDFYLSMNEGKYELFNNSLSFFSGDTLFDGKLSFIPSALYTSGDLSLFLLVKDISVKEVSNLIPNIKATKFIKSWINTNIDCGNLNSASLLYRGPADNKFTDTTSSFQMDFNLIDSCLKFTSMNINEIALFGEVDNASFKGMLTEANVFDSETISDIEISRDINNIYNLSIKGESHGPVSSIVDLHAAYNSSFVDSVSSGEHLTEFSFYTPLLNSFDLLKKSSLLKVKTSISDTSLVLVDNNFLLKNLEASLNYNSSEGFKKSSLSFDINSVPLQFDLSTKIIGKKHSSVITSQSEIKLRKLFFFSNYSKYISGSSLFNIDFILPGYIRGEFLSAPRLNIMSSLEGTEMKLFSPFNKDPKSVIDFRVSIVDEGDITQLKFNYGDLLRGRLVLRDNKTEGYLIAGPEKQSITVLSDQIRLIGSFKEIDLGSLSEFNLNFDSLSSPNFLIKDLYIKEAKLSSAIILDTVIGMESTKQGYLFSLNNRDFGGSFLLNKNQEIDIKLDFLKLNQNQIEGDNFFISVFNSINNPIYFSVNRLFLDSTLFGNWSFKLLPSKDSLTLQDVEGKYGSWEISKGKDRRKSELVINKTLLGWDSRLNTRFYSSSPKKAFSQLGLDANFSMDTIEIYPNVYWKGLPWEFEINKVVGKVGLFAEDLTIRNRDINIETPNNLFRLISLFNITDTFEKVTSLDFRKLFRSGFRSDVVKGDIYMDAHGLKIVNPIQFKSGSSEFRWNGSVTKNKSGKYNILDLEVVMTLPLREYLPAYALILGGPLTAGVVYIAGKAFKRNLDKLSSGKWTISGTLEEPKTNFEGWFED